MIKPSALHPPASPNKAYHFTISTKERRSLRVYKRPPPPAAISSWKERMAGACSPSVQNRFLLSLSAVQRTERRYGAILTSGPDCTHPTMHPLPIIPDNSLAPPGYWEVSSMLKALM